VPATEPFKPMISIGGSIHTSRMKFSLFVNYRYKTPLGWHEPQVGGCEGQAEGRSASAELWPSALGLPRIALFNLHIPGAARSRDGCRSGQPEVSSCHRARAYSPTEHRTALRARSVRAAA
jgi:hypothetical protein